MLNQQQPDLYKAAQENIAYYKGDDLFEVAWVGPTFGASDPKRLEKLAALKRVFQGHNVLQELVGNWKDGLISEPFTWQVKDSKGDRVQSSKAEIELQRWLDWVGQQALEQDPSSSNFQQCDPWSEFVLSLGVTGEGNLRLWQPERFSGDPDPIHRIHLHSPKVGSIQLTRRLEDGFIDSLTYAYGSGKREIQQLNAQRQLIVLDGEEELQIDTGGRWLIQQARMPALLTPSAKQKQASICHALTMKLRNQEVGGFKERTLTNAEFPESPIERGPGIDTYVYGIPQGNPEAPTYSTPNVHESMPVPVSTFVESIEIDRTLLYLEFRQGHLLSSGDGSLSGESRIQMRSGFELYLRGWQRPIESAIANTLTIVLRLLGYQDLQAVVNLNISTGKLSAEERDQILKEYGAGLLSKATAIARLGTVNDVDAELALIAEEVAIATKPTPDPL